MSATRFQSCVAKTARSTLVPQTRSVTTCTHSTTTAGSSAQCLRLLLLQVQTETLLAHVPVKSRIRRLQLGQQRTIHSSSLSKHTTVPSIVSDKTQGEQSSSCNSWNHTHLAVDTGIVAYSNSGNDTRISWGPGPPRIIEEILAKGTGKAASTPSRSPLKHNIFPRASSMDPNIDYWALYQEQLNQKRIVTETDLLRLLQWLRSKPITNDTARKMNQVMMAMHKRDIHYSSDVYNDFIYLHIKRNKFQEAQRAIDIIYEEPMDMATSQRTLALQMAMYLKNGDEARLQDLISCKSNGLMQYISQFLNWTRGLQLTSNDIERVKSIFRDLQIQSCPPNSRRFTHLLSSLFESNRPDEAFALQNHTLDLGFPINKYTASAMMSGLLKAGCLNEATQMWTRISEQPGTAHLDLPVMNALLSALCRIPKEFPAALELWNQILKDPEIKPDAHSFSSVMNGYFRSKNPDSAMGLWESMQQQPYFIKPDSTMYNIVLTGLLRNHLPEKAKVMFDEMTMRKKVKPTLDTYNIMIKGLLSVQDQVGVNKVMSHMTDSGIAPNATTYTIVTDVLFSQRDAGSAMKVADLMTSRKIPKTAITYSALIAGYVNVGMLDRAKETFEAMQQEGHAPSIHTYGAMMQCAFKGHDIELAENMARLAQTTTEEGMSAGAYLIMISGYSRLSLMDNAERWLKKFQGDSIACNSDQILWKSYYVLLKACVDNQLWASAERVLGIMREFRFQSLVPKLNRLIEEIEQNQA
ncbi:hypothetical protein BX616_011142 [Lobosporangium transversale]|uniref:Pentacotripeptide-repeat region of PRORP domain-containing protein n=1 Tax=Lobosporangium transversale TaxID=64571 RepID=A0A1Y2GEY3_9FUNG|nr:hypothetical protein BCR41DRAFT_359781 [Lobosporangium transversale]KAF9917844.1 hypothetical protein BX616_011142 [Lobosporangium transversale]ORZ08008.1 hypothetical protein BCR41DRAFT_359781 [Lobosporangium transversale]|eukprot:XP_021878242.1 hypothetical protein BCR41DRAFT_359781 [Lobosporangium transversale]